MKILNSKLAVFMILILAVSSFFFQACKKTQVSLQEDLSIGVEEGDENLIFGGISGTQITPSLR